VRHGAPRTLLSRIAASLASRAAQNFLSLPAKFQAGIKSGHTHDRNVMAIHSEDHAQADGQHRFFIWINGLDGLCDWLLRWFCSSGGAWLAACTSQNAGTEHSGWSGS